MKKLIGGVLMAMTLGGCVVVPAYEPAAGVYVYPSAPYHHGYYRGYHRHYYR